MVEPRAHISHVDQLFFLVVKPQNQRTKIHPAALWVGVSTDHALNGLGDFDLQPFPAAPFLVEAAPPLAENAFEPLLFGGLKQGNAPLSEVLGIADDLGGRKNPFENLLAGLEPDPAEIVAIEVNEIKNVVCDGHLGASRGSPPPLAEPRPLLHEAEGSTTFVVERNNFAVQNGGVRFDRAREFFELGKLAGEIVLIAREQTQFSLFD